MIKPSSIHSNTMPFQASLLSLFLLILLFASYVDASAKKNKKERVPRIGDESTGRGDAVTLPLSPVLKSKPKPASVLVDTTNIAPAVQLKDQGILVQSVPEESQVSERDEQTKRFGELISKEQYEEIAELGKKMSDKELLKCLCQVVTNLDHFKGLFGYLEQRNMVPDFLAQGETVLVRKVIVETDLLETDSFFGECNSIYDAIALSFKEDRHERVAGLFEAAGERPAWKNYFSLFVKGFFKRYPPQKISMPLKRFLSLYGEEFSKKHPDIFKTLYQELVWNLRDRLDNPASRKLLIDLVGQPSLLTPIAYARGLYRADDRDRVNFLKYGYKEATEEGLKEKFSRGGEYLWAVMVSSFQLSSLESIQPLTSHELLLSRALNPPSKISKKNGPRGTHRNCK